MEWYYSSLPNTLFLSALILAKVVQEAAPKTALELGTFLGYSAVVTAQNMPSDGKLITIEANPKSVEVARKIINRAGFADKVLCKILFLFFAKSKSGH